MAFVQVIEFSTKRFEEMATLVREYEESYTGERYARRQIITADHDDPGRYVIMVFFDDYESAMKNSDLPETGEMAGKLAALADGPPTFRNLDVLEERNVGG